MQIKYLDWVNKRINRSYAESPQKVIDSDAAVIHTNDPAFYHRVMGEAFLNNKPVSLHLVQGYVELSRITPDTHYFIFTHNVKPELHYIPSSGKCVLRFIPNGN